MSDTKRPLFVSAEDPRLYESGLYSVFTVGVETPNRVIPIAVAPAQGADDTQVVIAGLNALLHDAQDEIARLTATQGADAQDAARMRKLCDLLDSVDDFGNGFPGDIHEAFQNGGKATRDALDRAIAAQVLDELGKAITAPANPAASGIGPLSWPPCSVYGRRKIMSAADKYPIPTVQQIEEAVGMGAAGWDMIDPNSIIDAVIRLAAPTQGADARPVAIYQISLALHSGMWIDTDAEHYADYLDDYRRIVYATRDAVPSDGPEVPWRIVVDLAEKYGRGFIRAGWTFYCDDDLNAFAQAIAAIASQRSDT
jgi:hypothetical protein